VSKRAIVFGVVGAGLYAFWKAHANKGMPVAAGQSQAIEIAKRAFSPTDPFLWGAAATGVLIAKVL